MDFDSILASVHADRGISINMEGDQPPARGFMVSIQHAEVRVPLATLTAFDVESYVNLRHGLLRDPDRYLGIWVDHNGMAFLDVSERINGRAMAERLGRARNQLAIWDLAAQKEITLP